VGIWYFESTRIVTRFESVVAFVNVGTKVLGIDGHRGNWVSGSIQKSMVINLQVLVGADGEMAES
jgi:flavin-dependent dehydrogenase